MFRERGESERRLYGMRDRIGDLRTGRPHRASVGRVGAGGGE